MDRFLREAHYLCCFKSYVEEFEKEQRRLGAQKKRLVKDIEVAKRRNESQIEDEVQQWLYEADSLIQEDTETKKKWFFGLCSNCIWQYKRGKELERKTRDIVVLISERSEFNRLVHVKNYSSLNFIHFESRKAVFENLKETLEDDSIHMIGLVGLGGVGKTTMAKEVVKEVEISKVFDKVVFIVVSYSANVRKIQAGIARQLCLTLEEGMGSEERAASVWNRIANGGEKIFIILDDVQKNLNLKDIGIPIGQHHKNCCSVLLTTRYMSVCRRMGCQQIICLEVLAEMEAWNLFQLYAGVNNGDSSSSSSNDLKEVALQIAIECRGLPIFLVTLAKALNPKPLGDWEEALIRLKNPLMLSFPKIYSIGNLLKLSYDYLDNEKAKLVFLLCSLFSEDFEIPTELLCRVAIGLGLCGEVDIYHTARSQMLAIKDQLVDSCLLLKAEEECVKMHVLVRDAALRIGNEEIQVTKDFKWKTFKENIRYSSWEIDGFPRRFDGGKLEILLVWMEAKRYFEVPNALFAGMLRLRVLLLICTSESSPTPAPSLLQSIPSLRNIRTLVLTNWELGDISIMGRVQSLETLELNNCSITELPNEVKELEKLRLLGLRHCKIRRNNPFQVIQRCPQLEELYYVENRDILYGGNRDEELAQITIPPALQRYHIIGFKFPNSLQVDATTSRCFKPGYLKEIFSEATFKSLTTSAENLELGEYYEKTGWRNLIPDIVPMEDGGMKDLIRLSLFDWSEIECLISTEQLQSGGTIFSKLAELKLSNMDVKELCHGPLPIGFLKQLEGIDLKKCLKLESTLFKGNLDLGQLKSIKLEHCSMKSLFHPSTAQTLKHLETLNICECDQLKYITYEESEEEIVDDHDLHGRRQNSFPMSNTFSWAPLRCFLPKSSAKSIDNPSVSKATLTDHTGLKELKTQVFNMREINITHCSNLTGLFTLSFASSMSMLKKIQVGECHELKHIFTDDRDDDDDHRNYRSIFPNLQEVYVWNCHLLESLFPASHFNTLDRLKSLRISGTPKLRYVLGKCACDGNLPHQTQPAQESRLDVPNMSEQEVADEVDEEELEMQKQASSSPPTEGTKPSANKMVEQVPISDLPAMATPSSSSDMLGAIPQKEPSLIKEKEDPSIEEAPKLEKAVIANEIMESELSKASAAPFVIPLQNESPQNNEVSNGEGPSSHKHNKETSSTHSESDISHPGSLSFDKINSHSVLKNPQTVTSDTHIEAGSPHPNPSSPQSQIMMKEISPQQFGDDDLNRLFRLMEKGADIGVCMFHVSEIADNEVANAFADLEASLKMGLQEIASSEENSLRLENALNFLSTHYSEDGDPPYGLKSTIQSMHQEIASILSSFKQVSASKEKEITGCEIKLTFLQEQGKKKKSVSENIEFLGEFEAVKKEMSKIVEDKLKERQELEKWSSCVAKWWKTKLLQGTYLK